MKVALFGRNLDPKWNGKIEMLLDALASEGAEFCSFQGLNISRGSLFSSHEDLPGDVDLFLALGGDGTFLNSLTIVRDRPIPIAGINFGRLGFLTTAKVNGDGDKWISLLMEGKYDIEKRSVLSLESAFPLKEGLYPYALNEITIQRKTPYMIGIDLKINGERIPRYWADGILVATPTGSTAYSLSVGGPIVTPGSGVFIIAPIAPHNLNVRPLIIPDTSMIDIEIHTKNGEAVLTVDNRSMKISEENKLRLSKAPFQLNNVTFSKAGFFAALQEKLLWGEDKRNN